MNTLYEEHLTLIKGGGSFGIRSILEDKNGKFWFCNTKYRYHVQSRNPGGKNKGELVYTKEKGIEHINDPVTGDRIYFQSIAAANNGDMWMQTYRQGIWRYNGYKLVHYDVKNGDSDVKVISMFQDKSGGIWLGTDGNGIYKLYGNVFRRFRM